ncbi:MAG: T9SS type A sorting domain-containing protein, partial [Ignavibacterium sp.]|nr:T9SS type A sorting domain-containing protein [Ignavibacterium sp.]MDW8376314.1 T9SS type A sorting domain-containing protein [Ignavibacteriales bacterium]
IPKEFLLGQNYPNPFNPSTRISWQSPISGHHSLKVYDILGNEVATLVDEYKEAGKYEIEFNVVKTLNGISLPSGVYFYQLKVGNYIETKKMILLR